MKLAIIHSRAGCGIDSPEVTVEVHLSPGIPSLSIVGLPETAVKESKDRVRSAIMNSKFDFQPRRITVNLAPADLPKRDGGRFDLPIALGILIASEQLYVDNLDDYEFAGELALCGSLRGFNGVLPFAMATAKAKRKLILPKVSADEAALVRTITVLPANHLLDVCAHLTQKCLLEKHEAQLTKENFNNSCDLADIKGQEYAKRALEIVAAGGHSMLLIGPPGTGKTMLASRLPTILPKMTDDEALETAAVKSICGKKFNINLWKERPFRSPHHTASSVALVGGSSPPRPGEVSLAHNGVLFLDELPEFNRNVLEALREPMESKFVTISRAAYQAKFPANFQFIAAMNPCPCGNFGSNSNDCSCTPDQIQRYQTRISGPLLDRIDMHIEIANLPKGILAKIEAANNGTSGIVRARVTSARNMQLQRANKINSALTVKELENYCSVSEESRNFLENALEKMHLSARVYHRILKVARTIADLDLSDNIQQHHISESLSYRKLKKSR